MKTLPFDTLKEAEARSREEWEKALGRKKRPEDVTEFLWPVDALAGKDAILVIPDGGEATLTDDERAALRPLAREED